MQVTTSLRTLTIEEALQAVAAGGAFIDLREVDDYFDVHVPGSLSLEYERGPGMPGRARDCIPLSIPFVLLDEGEHDMNAVAAALRGKGFAVAGSLPGGVRAWAEAAGTPASTEVHGGSAPPRGTVLMVGDPGAPVADEGTVVPIEKLYERAGELRKVGPVVVSTGRGLRAALAIGFLERAGVEDVSVWRGDAYANRTFGKAGVVRVQPKR